MMITKVIAIAAIKPDAYCTSTFDENGVETVTYEDGVTPIDESLVDAKQKELQAIEDYKANIVTLKEHWNSPYMMDIRKKLMAGEKIPQCDVCNDNLSLIHISEPTRLV